MNMRGWLAWGAALLLIAAGAKADERILDFHDDVMIAADGVMTVTETIRVRAAGEQIHHGIYRDFPTDYADRNGGRVRVLFEPLDERAGEDAATFDAGDCAGA